MAAKHALMRIWNAARDLEDNRVEKNEAALLEQAAAELSRPLDRYKKHRIGKRDQCAFRLSGEQDHLGPLGFGDLRKVDADWRLSRSGDNNQPLARADRRGGDLTDKMDVAANMHEAHSRHLSDQPRASLTRKEPAARPVAESLDDAEKRFGVYASEYFGYFFSHGQPRPGFISLFRIHFATSLGFPDSVMALPTMTISGSNASTESMLSGPSPPASATRKPRRCISATASICAVEMSPAARASDGR